MYMIPPYLEWSRMVWFIIGLSTLSMFKRWIPASCGQKNIFCGGGPTRGLLILWATFPKGDPTKTNWPIFFPGFPPNFTSPLFFQSPVASYGFHSLFPTCQVRVVRFDQSACPPPPPPPPRLPLLALLLAPASSTSTSALPTLPTRRQALRQLPTAQCALLDVNLRAAQLSVHRWTSTCELPSSVCTAGPQPASCPAQCAPLDLNRGPAQLSVHRWTSTAR